MKSTIQAVATILFLLLLLASCTVLTPNPEKRICNDKCLSTKDECMVNAMSATDIEQCDVTVRKCINDNCSALPSHLEP